MNNFAENVAAICLTRERRSSDGRPAYKFSPQRAWLKRASGGPFSESRNMYWMLGLLDSDGPAGSVDEKQFLIATLLAFDKKALDCYGTTRHLPSAPYNLGASLEKLEKAMYPTEWEAKQKMPPDSKRRISPIERRLLLLLDTRIETDGTGDLPFRLRQIVKYALTQEASFDWNGLLRDLHEWDSLDKKPQKEWARSFYGYQRPQEASAEVIEDAANNNDDIDLDED